MTGGEPGAALARADETAEETTVALAEDGGAGVLPPVTEDCAVVPVEVADPQAESAIAADTPRTLVIRESFIAFLDATSISLVPQCDSSRSSAHRHSAAHRHARREVQLTDTVPLIDTLVEKCSPSRSSVHRRRSRPKAAANSS